MVPGSRTLTESGGKVLTTSDVAVLGDDTIHGVTNPRDRLTGAIHVYGGDFANQPRSQWGPGPLEERPYDIVETRQHVRRRQRRLGRHRRLNCSSALAGTGRSVRPCSRSSPT